MPEKIPTRKIRVRITTVTNEKLEGLMHVPEHTDMSLRLSDIIRSRKDSLLLLTGVADGAPPLLVNMDNVVYVELLE